MCQVPAIDILDPRADGARGLIDPVAQHGSTLGRGRDRCRRVDLDTGRILGAGGLGGGEDEGAKGKEQAGHGRSPERTGWGKKHGASSPCDAGAQARPETGRKTASGQAGPAGGSALGGRGFRYAEDGGVGVMILSIESRYICSMLQM
jgi:hypothetical protein